jgi:predicted porin
MYGYLDQARATIRHAVSPSVAEKQHAPLKQSTKVCICLSGLPNVGTMRPAFQKGGGGRSDRPRGVIAVRSNIKHFNSGDSHMQKKLIALAIAGLASSAAFAQSNVTVYGVVDYGYVNRGSKDGASTENGNRSEFASGVESGSRIGFKGTEDLGNGLKALFEIEYGVSLDTGSAASATASSTNPFWNRHSYVGLTGSFGTVVGGRVDGDRYGVVNKYDPFGGGTVASGVTVFSEQVTRGDNAIVYISPDFSGFNFLAGYTRSLIGNEPTGTTVKDTVVADPITGVLTTTRTGSATGLQQNGGGIELALLQVNYVNGPLALTANYETAKRKDVASSDIRISQFGGSYDFGVVKISALYDSMKDDIGAAYDYSSLTAATSTAKLDARNWLLGATFPVGNGLIRASYIRHNDKINANSDIRKVGIGYQYKLSKRTDIYTDYARIQNDSNATGQIGFSGVAGSVDNAQTAGSTLYGTRGFDIGVHHSF